MSIRKQGLPFEGAANLPWRWRRWTDSQLDTLQLALKALAALFFDKKVGFPRRDKIRCQENLKKAPYFNYHFRGLRGLPMRPWSKERLRGCISFPLF